MVVCTSPTEGPAEGVGEGHLVGRSIRGFMGSVARFTVGFFVGGVANFSLRDTFDFASCAIACFCLQAV